MNLETVNDMEKIKKEHSSELGEKETSTVQGRDLSRSKDEKIKEQEMNYIKDSLERLKGIFGNHMTTKPENIPDYEKYKMLEVKDVGRETREDRIKDFELDDFSEKSIAVLKENIEKIEGQIDKIESTSEAGLLGEQMAALSREKCGEYFKSFLKYLGWENTEEWTGFLDKPYEQIIGEKKKRLDKIREYVLKMEIEPDLVVVESGERVGEWLIKITRKLANKK